MNNSRESASETESKIAIIVELMLTNNYVSIFILLIIKVYNFFEMNNLFYHGEGVYCLAACLNEIEGRWWWAERIEKNKIEWSHRKNFATEMNENDAFIVFTANLNYDEYLWVVSIVSAVWKEWKCWLYYLIK